MVRSCGGPKSPDVAGVVIEAVRRAAGSGQVRLFGTVWDDYDRFEAHRWRNRFVALTFLVGLQARAVVRFWLPLADLPDGAGIEIDTRSGQGCWLYLPGQDPDDPVDLMGEAFEDNAGIRLLAGLILPAVFERHRFRTLRGWEDLTCTYWAHRFRYHPTKDGVHVTFVAEIDAHR